MPRKPRLFLPNQPQHIVVRDHNHDPILGRVDDFRFLYQCLYEAAVQHELAIHAWVFMNNHLHILATPADYKSIPSTMQSISRSYARYFTRAYHRSGALWDGRYEASPVDTEHYLLACYRYIELNPVRAGIVLHPEDYVYSSYHANALGRPDKLLTVHPVFNDYLKLKSSSLPSFMNPREVYIDLCQQALTQNELDDIRKGTEKGMGIGRADFLLCVAQFMG